MEKHTSKQPINDRFAQRRLLAAGLLISITLGVSAFAQQPAASPGTQLPENAPGPAAPPAPATPGEATSERVVVTGSYIPTAEEVTASPLDSLTSQEINRSGSQDVLQVLQRRNPDFVGGGNLGSSNANINAGNTLGGTVVSIRGFPSLVLYEGRRIADAAALAQGGTQFSDIGLFPIALISRIEVLKDGASALYGSEAVGGVINIFTRDDLQGAEVGFRYGTTVESAIAERRLYAVAGIGNGTTQVTAGMQYYEIDPLYNRQRSYSSPSLNGGTSNYAGSVRDASSVSGNGGRYLPIGLDPVNYPGNPVANSPFDVYGPALAGSIPPAPGGSFRNMSAYYQPATQAEILSFDLSRAPTTTLGTARTNVVASADHQIFGKQLELFGNFLYANSDFQSFLNAQPVNTNGTTSPNVPGGLVILGSVRVDPTTGALVPEDRGAPAPFNPFQESLDLASGSGPNRLIATNRYLNFPRVFDNTNNFYRFLGGLRSQINQDWMAESAFYYSKYDIQYVNSNLVDLAQLNSMIAGTAVDGNGNPIPPLDFFALNPIGTKPGQVSAEQFSTLFGANFRDLSSFQRVVDAKVVGFPFSLPAGKVGLSIGGEYRVEGFKVQDSPEIFAGSVPIQQIDVKRDIYSAFAEVNVPIIGSAMNIPLVYNLELGLAGRYDHYQGVSEDAWVPKVTLRYQPIKDLTLRATYSDSFIAPNLYQTNGPSSQGFSTGITIGGVAQDQAQVLTGSNPGLIPSTAETYTAGLVYSPSFIPGLTVSADYFRILQLGIVGTLGGNTILNSVDALGTASPYANLVAFGNFPGRPGSRPVTGPGELNGNLASVFYVDTQRNLGAQRTEGFDLSAHYNMDLHQWGQLELGLNAAVFTRYDLRNAPIGFRYYNVLGVETSGDAGFGALPDYRLTGLIEYRWQGFALSFNFNYIPEMLNGVGVDLSEVDQGTLAPVDDFFSVDSRLSYTFVRKPAATGAAIESKDYKSTAGGKESAASIATGSVLDKLLDGLTIAVGCNNMFNEQPPIIIGANENTDVSVYDPYGRFVYFEISKKF